MIVGMWKGGGQNLDITLMPSNTRLRIFFDAHITVDQNE
jgi:hypothetical protein